MIKLRYTVSEDEECYTAIRSVDLCIDCKQELDDIIEAFSDFLKASGYAFDGRIKLISKEETEVEDKVMLQAMAEHYSNLFEKEVYANQKHQPEKGTEL